MLRLVRDGEPAARNEALHAALERVTRGDSTQGVPILENHEAEALYRAFSSRLFAQGQLDAWVERLRADHPYDRIRRGKSPSLWVVIKWVFLGGEKPWDDVPVESVTAWAKRTERWIQEQIARVDQPMWLERPLLALGAVRAQIEHEIGRCEWHSPVLRWALVQLLTTPADVSMSDKSATG